MSDGKQELINKKTIWIHHASDLVSDPAVQESYFLLKKRKYLTEHQKITKKIYLLIGSSNQDATKEQIVQAQ